MKKIFFYTMVMSIVLHISEKVIAQQNVLRGGFTIARLKYGGGGDWYGNQSSVYNLLQFTKKNTNIDVNPVEARADISEDTIFNFPFLFMTGHGNIKFSEDDAARLRKHLTNGGFLHADDNYGMDKSFREEMKKVFPDKEWVELPFDHDIYNIHYTFPRGIPKIHEHDGGPGRGYALFHNGKMIAFYSANTDLSDGWEDANVHNDPQHIREAALKMGVNIIVYYLTR